MLQLERHVFVANAADQRAVSRAIFFYEHVEAHDALATHGNPDVRSLRSAQEPPVKSKCPGLYTEKLPASTSQGFTGGDASSTRITRAISEWSAGSARRLADFTPRVVQKFIGFGE